jgi:hypothetical protein
MSARAVATASDSNVANAVVAAFSRRSRLDAARSSVGAIGFFSR